MNIIGNRIRSIRNSLDLKGEEFGKLLNVTKVAVSNWENGNRTPDIQTLSKIADLGNVTADYLLGRTDDPKNIVYSATIDGDKVDLEFDKDYPHKLTPEEVEQLIKKLKEARFDVDGLIEEIQNKGKK